MGKDHKKKALPVGAQCVTRPVGDKHREDGAKWHEWQHNEPTRWDGKYGVGRHDVPPNV